MGDSLERELADHDGEVGDTMKEMLLDAANRLNCQPCELAIKMDKRGGVLVTTIKELEKRGI